MINQKVAEAMLKKLGYEVRIAANGQEAADAVTAGSFDVILMDCQMPVLDGYAATRAIRARESADHIPRMPIIAITANAMPGDREKCIEAGMDDYLSKPLGMDDLASTLERWVGVPQPVELRSAG